MGDENDKQFELVQEYQKLVLSYEALDEKIDDLIMANDGVTENMSKADLEQYRTWARERSEVLNQMRILEKQLDMDIEE